MTLLNELHALANTQRARADRTHCGDAFLDGVAHGTEVCADELTELLGKVVVTDEMVESACIASLEGYTPWDHPSWNEGNQRERLRKAMRAALESALGVTK